MMVALICYSLLALGTGLPAGAVGGSWLDLIRRAHGPIILALLLLLAAAVAFTLRKRLQRERAQRQVEIEMALVEVSDGVRRNVGSVLHDGLSHDILNVAVLFQLLARDHPQLPAEKVGAIETAFKETVVKTKRLARSLFPLNVEDRSFPLFLEELASWAEQQHGLACEKQIDPDLSPGDAGLLNHLHGIALEAAFNAARHSGTERIRITWGLADGRPVLRVRDWGRGLPSEPRKGQPLGLRLLEYRARMIGAELAVTAPPGGGTEICCALPAAALRKVHE